MSILLFLVERGALPLGLAGMTFAAAGLSFVGYNFAVARDRVTRRVEVVCHTHLSPVASAARPGRRRSLAMRLPAGPLPQHEQLELARRMARFDIPASGVAAAYFALRLSFALLLAAAAIILANRYSAATSPVRLIGASVTAGVIGWFIPQLILKRLVARRAIAVQRGLPDAIELLVIAVEAGLALEDGIDRIVAELRRSQPVVAEELALTSADLKILPSRDAALRRLADRVDLPSVRAVVTTLSQTMKYGTPLAQALRVVAAELRNDALVSLEERVNRMPVLLTVPMIVFILPSMFLVIGGPTILRLIDTFFP